jgi:signal transduction histidine kinase
MNETVERQEKYINEILNFAKNKNLALSYKEFSLKHLIENIIDNNKYAPLAQGINIYKDFEQDEIYSDELHVEMIINNLISNAIKYSDEQKPVKEVFIKTSRKVKNCIIEVEDNGIGIEEPYLNKIFDMFYVATNKNKGTGLGLYILKQTVEKLNGKIEVYSKPKVGTKFTISIPSFI